MVKQRESGKDRADEERTSRNVIMSPRPMWRKIPASVVYVMLLLAGCGTSNPGFKDDTSQPLALIARNAVHDAVPHSMLTKNGESFLGFSDDNGSLTIDAEPTDNASKSVEKDEVLQDTATIIRDLYTDPRVKDVKITWYTPGSDAYGNTIADVVATVDVSRDTESKINWSGFDYNNIPQIADSFQWGMSFQ